MNTLQLLAETTEFDVEIAQAWAKAGMAGLALGLAAMGLALVGLNYMKALGRNPEAGKVAGSVVAIAAMIEVTALLAFALAFIAI